MVVKLEMHSPPFPPLVTLVLFHASHRWYHDDFPGLTQLLVPLGHLLQGSTQAHFGVMVFLLHVAQVAVDCGTTLHHLWKGNRKFCLHRPTSRQQAVCRRDSKRFPDLWMWGDCNNCWRHVRDSLTHLRHDLLLLEALCCGLDLFLLQKGRVVMDPSGVQHQVLCLLDTNLVKHILWIQNKTIASLSLGILEEVCQVIT